MADDLKPATSKPIRFVRAKDFRVAYSNTFRFRISPGDIAIAFGYQTEIPDQGIIQDEVEVVLTPATLKVLKLAMDDTLEAVEKAIGSIQLPPEIMEQITAAKTAATAAAAETFPKTAPTTDTAQEKK
jgi:hypothetical protein